MLEFLRRNRLLATAALFLAGRRGAGRAHRRRRAAWRDDRLGRPVPRADGAAPARRRRSSGRTLADVWRGAARSVARRARRSTALRARVRELERDTARLAEAELENARLRELLAFRQTLAGELLTARVIGHDASGLSRTITIDQGERGGRGAGRRGARARRPRRPGLPGEPARRARAADHRPQQRRRRRRAAHARRAASSRARSTGGAGSSSSSARRTSRSGDLVVSSGARRHLPARAAGRAHRRGRQAGAGPLPVRARSSPRWTSTGSRRCS